MTTEKGPKGPIGFICEKCDFKCYKKSKYERHLNTAKHKKQHLTTVEQQKKLECICGKKYKERTALYRHKKKCNYKTPEQIKEEELIQHLKYQSIKLEEQREEQKKHYEEQKKQNEELKEQISGMSLVTNNNTINNNTFNLKLFLNNDCKDAMGMTEFLNSIQVCDEDLKMFDEEGYVKAMTTLIERHLSKLAITERPIHCTDKKRQTIYFKSDKEGWKKDDEKKQVALLIEIAENKSYDRYQDILTEIQKQENVTDPDSPYHKWYIRMGTEVGGGEYDNEKMNKNKLSHIITNLVYKSSKV